MSAKGHAQRTGPDPAAEIKLPWFATSLDVDLTELTGSRSGEVIVLALIVPRRPSEARERAPVDVGRHHSAVTPIRERGVSQRHPIGWFDLTDRERAVACLAGRALTNQQIANRLGISPHTVNFHLRQIFRKLDIESRVQLARFPVDQPAAVVDVRPMQSG
jgi:DNA-binding CsgD family transcriptional regulator